MSAPEYIDCFLKITGSNHATLEFQGETYSGKPKLDPAYLQQLLLKTESDPRQYGIELFRALFPPGDDLNSGYRSALSIARRLNSRLRFRLQIDVGAPADLLTINWERLYDEKERQTLSRWSQTAFSRFTGLGQPVAGAVTGAPKVLVVISSPTDAPANLSRIDQAKFREELDEALQPLSGFAQYQFLDGRATRSRIRERLLEGFNAIHIQAHGLVQPDRDMAWMMLEKENGETDPIDEDFLRDILGGLPDLRLVVLMACHSGASTRADYFGGLAQTLIQQNLPVVIAMQRPIEFDSAKIFNKYFYGELARHGQVDTAVNEARLQLRLSVPDSNDWSAPVVFMRLTGSALWDRGAALKAHEPPVEINTEEESFWAPILEALNQGQLVPIIGPDINQGLLPSNEEVTSLWSKKWEYPRYNYPLNNRNDLPRVARFVETINTTNTTKYPHRALQTLYTEELLEREKTEDRAKLTKKPLPDVISAIARRYFESDPEAPHRILADLNVSTYLTTTPDNFMAEALKYCGREPRRELIQWWEGVTEPANYQVLNGTRESPIVWHLFGASPKTPTLVLTEDDHLDFLRNVSKEPWRLPVTLMSTLTESLLLFLGFNVRDLDFRILFKALISHLKVASGRVAILQIQPEQSYKEREFDLKLVRNFLENDSTEFKITIRWSSVRDFLLQLRDKQDAS